MIKGVITYRFVGFGVAASSEIPPNPVKKKVTSGEGNGRHKYSGNHGQYIAMYTIMYCFDASQASPLS